jgi:hypothetical protein
MIWRQKKPNKRYDDVLDLKVIVQQGTRQPEHEHYFAKALESAEQELPEQESGHQDDTVAMPDVSRTIQSVIADEVNIWLRHNMSRIVAESFEQMSRPQKSPSTKAKTTVKTKKKVAKKKSKVKKAAAKKNPVKK